MTFATSRKKLENIILDLEFPSVSESDVKNRDFRFKNHIDIQMRLKINLKVKINWTVRFPPLSQTILSEQFFVQL